MSAATASPTFSLTVAPHFVPPPVEALPRPMCCVALAYRVTDGQAWRLGTAEPGSVWGAVLWLSLRAAQLADQLDPPAARALRAWLDSDAEAERATAMLLAGQPYFLLVPDAGVHYVLSAAPEEGPGDRQPSGSVPAAAPGTVGSAGDGAGGTGPEERNHG